MCIDFLARDARAYLKNNFEVYTSILTIVLFIEIISIGTIDSNIVHPREVFRPALEYNAAAVVLAHKEIIPLGCDCGASDIQITNQIIEAGKIMVFVLDHLSSQKRDSRVCQLTTSIPR